jgi:hypothetical protein
MPQHVGAPSTGIMSAGGNWQLVPDDITSFVVIEVLAVSETSGEVVVVEGATVDLVELGAPAPAGDDYVPVRTTTSERVEDDGSVVQVTIADKLTFADIHLATVTTERHGLARFAILPDDAGGLMSVTTKQISAGPAFTVRHDALARGDAPDLALTVTLGDGYRPFERRPIAVNLA